ncbi:MAG: ABC transporter ATP-binding protein [Armatimonadota bacterium]
MRTLKRIMGYAYKYWPLIILNTIIIIIISLLELAWPQVQRLVIDEALEQGKYHLLPYFSLGIIVLFLIRGAVILGRDYVSQQIAQLTIYDIRNKLFNHLQRLSFTYHDTIETGQVISISTTDTDAIGNFISIGLVHLVSSGLVFICVFIICFIMNWQLTLVSMFLLPIIGAVVFKYSGKVRPLYIDVQNHLGVMTSSIQQNITGITVVKAFLREEFEINRFKKLSDELFKKVLSVTKLTSFYSPLLDFMGACGVVTILWYGGYQVINGKLTLGELVTFNTYLTMLLGPVRMSAWYVSIIQSAIASGGRVFEILDIRKESDIQDGNIDLRNAKGKVEFKNVSFKYQDDTYALHNITFSAEPGEIIGIMGPTGSGKTSIVNLIPRFYDATEGSVFIDCVDVKEYTVASLRKQISLVAQESFLFADTIRTNITYGKPNATDEEIVEAAKIADIHDFIMALPDGYDTEIGERGVNLSGGQKQRICLARAIIKNSPILLMDDCTSSVDTETEAHIQEALKKATVSRTTFIISQRVSSVIHADKIIILEDGRIVEFGNHQELMALGGRYAERYYMQFKDAETTKLELD